MTTKSRFDHYRVEDASDTLPFLFEGLHYEDAEALVRIGKLKLCGCGSTGPLLLIRDMLASRREWLLLLEQDRDRQIAATGSPFTVTSSRKASHLYDVFHKRHLELLGSENSLEFFWHMMDSLKLMEHGSYTGSGWLTDKGLEVLLDLEALYDAAPKVFVG